MLSRVSDSLEAKQRVLVEISHKLRDTLDLSEILQQLLDCVQRVVACDAVGIFVLNRDFEVARPTNQRSASLIAGIANRGFDPHPIERDRMLMRGEGVVGSVIHTGQSVIIPDVRNDQRYVAGRMTTRSEVAVPILLNEHVIGALNLESDQLAAFDEDDLQFLLFVADAAAVSIDKAILHQRLIEKEITDRQLKNARDVQMQLLPQCDPKIAGYEIAGKCLSAFDIGGDYFDYVNLDSSQLGIALADVSGHGIPAALVMSAFRALLRTHLRGKRDPGEAATAINTMLPEVSGTSDFTTAFIAVLEPKAGKLVYTNCGHPPAILFREDGQVATLCAGGSALGIFPRQTFDVTPICLAPNDLLLLYTDGVTEASNPQGQTYGIERLRSVIRDHWERPCVEIIDAVLASVHSHVGSNRLADDLTLVLLRRLAKTDGLTAQAG